MALVDNREVVELPEWESATPVAVITQTTLSVDDTRQSIEKIEQRFSNVIVRNDLCYATTNRQAAVKELCRLVDVVLVIGCAQQLQLQPPARGSRGQRSDCVPDQRAR